MITVNIDIMDSQKVEKAFYEYNATLDILSFILKQENINQNYIKQYTERSEQFFITLEQLKNEISSKYHPNDDNQYNYSFDFINHTINYSLLNE